MGITSALYSAISGLQTNSQGITVTGNNISNSNTVGYKSSSATFADLLSATISSSSGSAQVGRGTQLQSVQTNFSQGGFESTESSTDLAIEGSGFFIVSDPNTNTYYYTRNGSFSFDDEGYLVTADGLRIQGSLYNADGKLASGSLSDVLVDTVAQIGANATSEVTLQTNLDSNTDIIAAFDITDPETTSNYSTTTTLYDTLGTAHQVTCYFTKTNDQTWQWNIAANSDELTSGTANDLTSIGTGTITFDADGNLLTGETGITAVLDWNNGSDATRTVTYAFETTQFDSDSTVFAQEQDGYTSGEVSSVDIGSDGIVTAVYSNGEIIEIAKLTLATFNNPEGLRSAGSSLFSATLASGSANIGYPGESQGTLVTQSLELSNVDLSAEFIDLITLQSGYTANSRVITTVDEMLQEVLNLKR